MGPQLHSQMNLTKVSKQFNGEMEDFSTNGTRIKVYLYEKRKKKLNPYLILYRKNN